MHDGRFETLEQVVEHYGSYVEVGPALDSRTRTTPGDALNLNLSAADKAALAAFLRTLDNETLRLDSRFADPFHR
jgi:cytochrome c peroxidase